MEEITKTITIEGMQCNHCKMSVEKALNAIDGITQVIVNLANKNATITTTKSIDNSIIEQTIAKAGFVVKAIK